MDQLLQQGTSQFIKDEIIGLSEEFHIITPYTSLLVLETDADRERFGVNRRFEMRDGERFFADGRDNAKYELLQQQMKKAGDWRIGLRRSVLSQLAKLGRSTVEMQQFRRLIEQQLAAGSIDISGQVFAVNGPASVSGGYSGFTQLGRSSGSISQRGLQTYGWASGFGGGGGVDCACSERPEGCSEGG